MSKEWYLMSTNTYFSGFENDEIDSYAVGGFEELLQVSGEAEDIVIDSIPTRGIVQKSLADSEVASSARDLLTHIGTSRIGAYIEFRNDIWLVVTKPDHNTMYEKSIVRRCNKTLKWINKNNILVTKPAIITSQTLYTTGIKEEKLIQVPDGMTGILFPYDDDTKALERDMSFIFNKAKYTITHYNEADRPGLLALICEESIPDGDYDDLENEIADRWDKDRNDRLDGKGEDPGNGELSIVIGGADSIFVTDKATYTATVYNNDVAVDEPVTFEISNTSLAKIESQGNNQCVVRANSNFNTGRVTLTATLVSDEAVFTEKEIRIVGM